MEGGKDEKDASSSSSSNKFPAGLRILVVDDDRTCLKIVEKMLKKCRYEVTACQHASIALSILREEKRRYDIVLTDVYMPDMDGFQLLEIVGLEMDIPVVMMSADCDVRVALKGLEHGACYYLMKPVSMNEAKNIWQHIVRRRREDGKEIEQLGCDGKETDQTGNAEENTAEKKTSEGECASSVNEETSKQSKKRKEEEDEDGSEDNEESKKKPRVIWNSLLHSQFLNAINQIGIDRAVPKKILELMNVPWLTRENVASHLQKYRLFLRRLDNANQSQMAILSTGPLKSRLGFFPPHMISNYHHQTTFPGFSESQNLMGFQPEAVSKTQNLTASPMPMPSNGPMQFTNQDSSSNIPLAGFGFGQSMLNTIGNMQRAAVPGSNGIGPTQSLLQQRDGNMGFEVLPQHNRLVPASLVDTMPTIHQQTPARRELHGNNPSHSFNLENVQSRNNFSNMDNAGSLNKFNQLRPLNYTSNYSGLHLTSTGGLYGMSQARPLCESSNNTNSGYILMNATSKGKMPIQTDGKDMHPEVRSIDSNFPDDAQETLTNVVSQDRYLGSFPSLVHEQNSFGTGSTSRLGGNSLSDILKNSGFGMIPQHFDEGDLEDLVFDKQQVGTDPMDAEFDFNTFQTGGSGEGL